MTKTAKKQPTAARDSSREIVLSRVFDAPLERVWEAWTLPGPLRLWWAPAGCATPFCEVDLRPGGRFRFCMRMPGGKDIWGLGVYKEVVKREKIVYLDSFADSKGNPVPPSYYGMSPGHPAETMVTVTFAAQGTKTIVTLRHEFPETVPERKGTERGWNEMLDSLAGQLAEKPAFELEFTRVIDAPRARVYEAWTKPEQMARWFAPKPFQLIVKTMDLRPGGRFSMAMRSPDGKDFPFTGTYREVAPPARLVWTGEFSTGPADQMTTAVTFEEQGRKTKLHARQTFHVMTPEIEHAAKGARQGWTMTLGQLTAFCTGGRP